MKNEIDKIISKIAGSVNQENFLEIAENKIEELEGVDPTGISMEALLRIIEENPEINFGLPGPLVHFLESFYKNGYEVKLIESIKRSPCPHNIWMLNRVINGSEGNLRLSYINELDLILARKDISKVAREAANEFRALL